MNAVQNIGGRLLDNRWTATAFALLLLVASLFLAWQSERSATHDRTRQVSVQAQILASSVSAALAFDDRETVREFLYALRLNSDIQAAAVYDAQGIRVDGYVTSGGALPAIVGDPHAARVIGREISVVVPVRQQSLELGHVYVRAAIESWTDRASRYAAIGIILVLAALLIMLLGAANAAGAAANERLRAEIDAREEAEAALRQSQKMEAMGQLTGGVAHDFNNLLMAASRGLELLDRTQDPARREKLRNGIREALDRGAKLTQQLLTFARRAPLRKEVIDVATRLTNLSDLLDRSLRQDISVKFELEPALWPIEVDGAQFDVAVLNIAVNARDAMTDGGQICIRARNAAAGLDRRDAVEIAIEDNGAGMSAEVVERVFEPFFTTKGVGRGTGLGLSQVYGFVHAANGVARISSTEGIGTTVTMLIPRCEAPEPEDQTPDASQASEPRSGFRILLAEDDEQLADLVSDMLRELGCEVVCAASAEPALQLFSETPVDAVLSDMVMPGEGNGLELARELRRRRPDLPILLMTGYSQAAGAAAKEGFQVLSKPFSMDVLAAQIGRMKASENGARVDRS